jgi:hypothetical protein
VKGRVPDDSFGSQCTATLKAQTPNRHYSVRGLVRPGHYRLLDAGGEMRGSYFVLNQNQII